jgi:NAD(P)-dependent dehydrogenase (short-subunit alcohol dehydrogenase family)
MAHLDERVAIVTGAAGGTGAGVARGLAAHGARVVAVDDKGADAVVQEITSGGGTAISIAADVADFEQAGTVVQEALAAFGGLDVVVNAAGAATDVDPDVPIWDATEHDWDAIVRQCLRSTFTVSRHAAAHWRANRGQPYRLINLTSPSALFGASPSPYFSGARLAVVGFTLSCANALARYGVTSNVLAPLAVEGSTAPVDVSAAAVFLASAESEWLNGKVIGAGDHRIVLFESPVIEHEVLVLDDWDRPLVHGEMDGSLRSAVERSFPFPELEAVG